jgi:histidyl-tRNA synthetase
MSVDRPHPGQTPVSPIAERPIGLVRGTRDWLPAQLAELDDVQRILLDQFRRAGYLPMRTPILEFAELHERKSGAGIVAKLFELPAAGTTSICLRPELTASIVRAYVEAEECPLLPFRVAMVGPVFRFQPPEPGRDREFTQAGVELLGAGGPAADAEVIALADRSLRALGVEDSSIRIGHVGLILELLGRSGLPPAATSALVESLSEAAAEGHSVRAIESALERMADWLGSGTDDSDQPPPAIGLAGDGGVDRLFRHLVPDVTGRRLSHEIIGRMRRKWELGHSLHEVLERVRHQVHALADLRGPADQVLGRLEHAYATLAPDSVAALRELMAMLDHHGIATGRVELDLGFGRGIGFYTQTIFELIVPTRAGPVEVCGGGRYDGLARVLGSERDDRGVGFAFGLERLASVLRVRGITGKRPGRRGFLVAASTRGAITPASVRLADALREDVDVPVVLTELGLDAAVAHGAVAGLSHLVTVEPRLEAWDLETGSVRAVEWNDLLDLGRGRLEVLESD